MPWSLPPARRLRRRGEFQRVFDQGRRVHGRFLTIIVAPSPAPEARLGIVASRKLGSAVARNRAKRLIREMFRQASSPATALDIVIIPRPGMIETAYATLAQDFRAVLRRYQGDQSKS